LAKASQASKELANIEQLIQQHREAGELYGTPKMQALFEQREDIAKQFVGHERILASGKSPKDIVNLPSQPTNPLESYAKPFVGPMPQQVLQPKSVQYKRITTAKGLQEFLKSLPSSGHIALDTETTAFSEAIERVRLLQLSAEGGPVGIVDLLKLPKKGRSILTEFLASSRPKIIQNAPFDIKALLGEGYKIGGQIYDPMVAEQVLSQTKYGKSNLGYLASKYLNISLPKEAQKSKWGGRLSKQRYQYAARDVAVLHDIMSAQSAAFEQVGIEQYNIAAKQMTSIQQRAREKFITTTHLKSTIKSTTPIIPTPTVAPSARRTAPSTALPTALSTALRTALPTAPSTAPIIPTTPITTTPITAIPTGPQATAIPSPSRAQNIMDVLTSEPGRRKILSAGASLEAGPWAAIPEKSAELMRQNQEKLYALSRGVGYYAKVKPLGETGGMHELILQSMETHGAKFKMVGTAEELNEKLRSAQAQAFVEGIAPESAIEEVKAKTIISEADLWRRRLDRGIQHGAEQGVIESHYQQTSSLIGNLTEQYAHLPMSERLRQIRSGAKLQDLMGSFTAAADITEEVAGSVGAHAASGVAEAAETIRPKPGKAIDMIENAFMRLPRSARWGLGGLATAVVGAGLLSSSLQLGQRELKPDMIAPGPDMTPMPDGSYTPPASPSVGGTTRIMDETVPGKGGNAYKVRIRARDRGDIDPDQLHQLVGQSLSQVQMPTNIHITSQDHRKKIKETVEDELLHLLHKR